MFLIELSLFLTIIDILASNSFLKLSIFLLIPIFVIYPLLLNKYIIFYHYKSLEKDSQILQRNLLRILEDDRLILLENKKWNSNKNFLKIKRDS